MSVLSVLETRVRAKLAPILEANGGPLKVIKSQTFSGSGDTQELLEKHVPQMPCGFLSVPDLQFRNPRETGDSLTFDANYTFLAVTNSQRESESRHTFYEDVLEHFIVDLGDTDFSTSTLEDNFVIHFLQAGSSRCFDFDNIGIMELTFTVPVHGPCGRNS